MSHRHPYDHHGPVIKFIIENVEYMGRIERWVGVRIEGGNCNWNGGRGQGKGFVQGRGWK